MIPTLKDELEAMLNQCLVIDAKEQMPILLDNIVMVVEYVSEKYGILEPSDGGWWEYYHKKQLRPTHISSQEREDFQEALADAFMGDDLDGDVTKNILRTVGLK